MGDFDKRMALDVVEDALTSLRAPEDRGFAVGLCGAFYMCGLLEHEEWMALLGRIPPRHEEGCSLCSGAGDGGAEGA